MAAGRRREISAFYTYGASSGIAVTFIIRPTTMPLATTS
jgi:hypothetical protein